MAKPKLVLLFFIILLSPLNIFSWLVRPNNSVFKTTTTTTTNLFRTVNLQYTDKTILELMKQNNNNNDNNDNNNDSTMAVPKNIAWSFRNSLEKNSKINDKDPIHYDGILASGSYGYIFSICFHEKDKKETSTDKIRGLSLSHYARELGYFKCNINSSKKEEPKRNNILCLHRHKIWWMRPMFITPNDSFQYPSEVLFMLGMDNDHDEHYRLVLPLIVPSIDNDGCTSCSLGSSSTLGKVEIRSETGGTIALYCGIGTNPFELIQEAIQLGSTISYNQKLTSNHKGKNKQQQQRIERFGSPNKLQQLPNFMNGLGWCTWNAFYTQVSGEKIISAVQNFHEKLETPIQWVIMDDGWQHSTTKTLAKDGEQWGERLMSFQAHPDKFPSSFSLKQTIQILKEQKHIKAILAWHTLPGYWLGIDEKMILLPTKNHNNNECGSSLYLPRFPSGIVENDPSALREHSITKGIRIPNDMRNFYNTYHKYLRDCGIDGIKVDAQAVCGILHRAVSNNCDAEKHHSVACLLHNHLAKSVIRFSSKPSLPNEDVSIQDYNIIHCMSHAPEIIYRLPHLYNQQKVLMRASDDHHPSNPFSRGPHIVDCAFNSLLLGTLTIPDWDMFTTKTSTYDDTNGVLMDAISRAVSGGPIYISDAPNSMKEQNNQCILKRLVCDNGAVLTCCDYGRPIRSCLLQDPLTTNVPLVIQNVNGNPKTQKITSGVLAMFHLTHSGTWDYEKLDYIPSNPSNTPLQSQTISLCATDVDTFHDNGNFTQYAIFSPLTGKLVGILPDSKATINFELEPSESNIVNIIPLYHDENNKKIQFIPVGLYTFYNPGGAILDVQIMETTSIEDINSPTVQFSVKMTVKGGGDFRVYFQIDNTTANLNYNHGIAVIIDRIKVPHSISFVDDHNILRTIERDQTLFTHDILCVDFNVPCKSDVNETSIIRISIC